MVERLFPPGDLWSSEDEHGFQAGDMHGEAFDPGGKVDQGDLDTSYEDDTIVHKPSTNGHGS